MLPQKLGYPLYRGALPSNHPLRLRGIRIGDVGIIQAKGSFQYAFNIFAQRFIASNARPDDLWTSEADDHMVNCLGDLNHYSE